MTRLVFASMFCAAFAAPALSLFISLPSLTRPPVMPIEEHPAFCGIAVPLVDVCAMPIG